MSWTVAELESIIAAYKAAILALASGAQEYEIDLGLSKRKVKNYELKDLRETLNYFQGELDLINGNSVGRTYAKQGGRAGG